MYPIEIWKEVFKNKIPKDQYEVLLESGEKTGLIIKLSSENYKILIDFVHRKLISHLVVYEREFQAILQ